MNKKEWQELRRQLKWDNDSLQIRGLMEAYGKNREEGPSLLFTRSTDPVSIEKEEGELYFEIFRKSLSGTPGKNLTEYEFDSSDPDSLALRQRFYELKNGSLLDEKTFEKLAAELIEKGDYRNPVYITAGLFEYAVSGMNANREALEDGSFFRFFIIAISEAKLTEIGLYYSRADNQVLRKINEDAVIIPSPLDAFAYPSFTERASDVSHLIYRCKAAKSPNIALIEDFFHIPFSISASEQSEAFAAVIADLFPAGMDAQTALKFHENVSDYIRESSQEQSDVMVDKNRVADLLAASGAPQSALDHFDSAYAHRLEDQPVSAVNLVEKGRISVKAPSISISVRDDALEKIESRTINGKPCLVITLDEGVELSGLPVSFLEKEKQ